jgi:hypothetical protein
MVEVVLVHDVGALLGNPVAHGQHLRRLVDEGVVAGTAAAGGELAQVERDVVVHPKAAFHLVVELHHLARPRVCPCRTHPGGR